MATTTAITVTRAVTRPAITTAACTTTAAIATTARHRSIVRRPARTATTTTAAPMADTTVRRPPATPAAATACPRRGAIWTASANASSSAAATTARRRGRMACRKASRHRNRRCVRRNRPAQHRPATSLRGRRSCPVSTAPRSAGRNNEGVPAGLAFRPALQSTWHSVTDCVSFGPDRIMPVHADVRWETLDPPCSGPCRMSAPRRTESPAPSRAFRFGRIPGRKTGKKNGAGDLLIADPRAPPPRARPAPVPIPATPDGRGAAAGAMWLSARTVPTLARRLPGDRIPPQPSPGRRPCLPPSAPMISTTTTSS